MTKDKKQLGKFFQELPVKLKDGELLERAKKAGDIHQELQRHIAEADVVKRRLRQKEAELTEAMDALLDILKTGEERREVEVEAWANFRTGRFQEVRTDTLDVISERELRPEERQGEFDLEGWQEELHQRAARAREEAARARAGDVGAEG